jgi:pantoate--beta-alanine ligase
MKIVHSISEMQSTIIALKRVGKTVGVVPTMGALHEGHLALLDEAKSKADISIVTLFVNPTQFGEGEDLDKYPRTLEQDCKLAEQRGADYLFAPLVADMYPTNYDTTVTCGGITTRLEGASRPGHFDGVTTVVLKLFNITQPDIAVFGQKDAQQVLVLSKMVRELNYPVELVIHPIVREDDGIAMSSRNLYLTPNERSEAVKISAALKAAKTLFDSGERNSKTVSDLVLSQYSLAKTLKNEYVAITDSECENIEGDIAGGALLSVVCRCTESGTRLIDNIFLG